MLFRSSARMNNLNDIFFAPAANDNLTYDQILEDVQRYFSENHASTIAEAGEEHTDKATTVLKELMEQYIVKRKYTADGLTTKELCEKLYEDMAGYSFLNQWIYKPGVEEVNINAYNDIEVIMNSGRSIKIPDKFSSPQHAIDVVRRMLNACGMVIEDTMPSVIGFLVSTLPSVLSTSRRFPSRSFWNPAAPRRKCCTFSRPVSAMGSASALPAPPAPEKQP